MVVPLCRLVIDTPRMCVYLPSHTSHTPISPYPSPHSSHENEKRLIKKCRQLNQEIVANAAKVQTALRLSLQDQHSITLLKKEIDKAWRMVDGAQEKEKRARENVQHLKQEIANLTRLVDQGAGLSIGQENTVNELLKRKEELKLLVEEYADIVK